MENIIRKITKDFGKLDIIVANSGITSHQPAEDYTSEQWHEIMRVNLDGAFYTAQAAARVFKEQGFGNVIFTASVSASLVNLPQKQAAVSIPIWQEVRGLNPLTHVSTTHPKLA
jgi:D-xylose/L-arabinose reductase (NADPH)